jgi:hypothetical protein
MFSTLRRLMFLLAFMVSVSPGDDVTAKNAAPGIADLRYGVRAILWRDPSDIPSLNLLYGAGSEDRQPRGTFTFVEEDMNGSNPKFDVRDKDGVKWKVKLGAEARPEVAATRLVWAAGYFTQEDYFVEDLHVEGLPHHLHRGQNLIGPDGIVHNVRLKRSMKGEEKLGAWHWNSNPFVGTRELNGLRVLMALINNWDLKDSNNALYLEKHPKDKSVTVEETYLVSDLGASFGPTGFKLSTEASRGNLEAYKRSKFIGNRTADAVDFEAPGRPPLIETFNPPVYVRRNDLRSIGKHIPRADAKWMGEVLGRLSPEQIRDAFRAAGYSAQEADEFATVVQGRIAELNAL